MKGVGSTQLILWWCFSWGFYLRHFSRAVAIVAHKMASQGNVREVKSQRYLRKHKIPEMLENLTAALVYSKPENPKEFMKEYFETLKAARDKGSEPPSLLDESNIISIYGMMDFPSKGYITTEQYHVAMKSIGVCEYNTTPIGTDIDKITQETFLREAKSGLLKAVGTYA